MENLSEIKDRFFNRLFTQLKINEKHHQSQEYLMLEMYLAHNFSNASNQQFKEFIDIIKDETEERLERKPVSDNDVSNFVLRRDTFKRLFKSTKILYDILRAILQNTFSEKYSYLLLDEIALGAVKKAASSLSREDYFWVGFLQLGFKKAFNWNDLHGAVFQCASLNTADAAELNPNHPLLKSISINWRSKFNGKDLTEEIKKQIIVPTLKEYFALDNPFISRVKTSSLKQIANVSPATISADFSSPLPLVTASISAEFSPIQHAEKLGTAKVSSTNGVVDPMCLEQVRVLLSKLITKETSTSRNPQVSTKSHRSKNRELKSADSHSVSVLKDAFHQLNISPTVAFEFFKNKSKGLATNEVVFSTYRADELVAGKGIRSYTANSSMNQILSAGFCTCIVHAIRLLCLFKTVPSSDQKLQNVLRIMVKDIKTDPWKVDEVMLALNLELSSVTFQSLALSFVNLIGQSAYLGEELSLATFSSTNEFIKKVKDLYRADAAAGDSNMLFISLTGNPSSKEIDLPYVFPVKTAKSYEKHVGDKLIDLADDSDSDSKSVNFQTVGMVYSLSEVDKPTLYIFQFITYSHCIKDGQYQVYEHVPFPYGDVTTVHKVSLREDGEKEGSEPPETLKVQLQSGHSLVGLILVRNRKQDGAKHPFLTPETIRTFPNPSISNDGDACNLTCTSLQILNSTQWLNDELVQAMTHIMFSALLSNHKGSQLKIAFRSSLTFVTQFMQQYRKRIKYDDLIKKNDYIIYTVNIGNTHWICLCIAIVWKKVFTLDSFNSYDTCKSKANLVIDFLKAHYNEELTWVHLRSPSQADGCSCGIFSALNASFFLKTILEGSMTENGPNVTNWSKKRFSFGDKAEIRETLKAVIYDAQDGSALLKWIN
jgi:hypothetical protein